MTTQFVVQLRNRPGALADFARKLAARGVDIADIAGGGMGDVGYAIVTTSDEAKARQVLRASGHLYAEGRPVIVEIEDRPGELASVTEKLADAGNTGQDPSAQPTRLRVGPRPINHHQLQGEHDE